MKSPAHRADPLADLDLGDFVPTPPKKPIAQPEVIRKVSEENNFPSRAPQKPKAAKVTQRRHRTGRNIQFNIKATQETIDRFTALSDKHGWVFGETLAQAIEALEKSLARKAGFSVDD
jgi:hypothetical protein